MTVFSINQEYLYEKEMDNSFHPADVVEVDFKERTIVPRLILNLNQSRGVIQEVVVGYDVYRTEDCVSKVNDYYEVINPLPDLEKGQILTLQYSIFERTSVHCETITKNSLYKIIFENQEDGTEEVMYYKKRKYIYKVSFPLVYYPLFGKPSYSFTINRDVEEDYLTKVGNTFQQTSLIKPKSFSERLSYGLQNGFKKPSIFHGLL